MWFRRPHDSSVTTPHWIIEDGYGTGPITTCCACAVLLDSHTRVPYAAQHQKHGNGADELMTGKQIRKGDEVFEFVLLAKTTKVLFQNLFCSVMWYVPSYTFEYRPRTGLTRRPFSQLGRRKTRLHTEIIEIIAAHWLRACNGIWHQGVIVDMGASVCDEYGEIER